MNVPPLDDRWNWETEVGSYRTRVLDALQRHGLPIAGEDIETERITTPLDFARTYNAYRGAIYGTSSNRRLAAFLRPPNRARELKHLFFAGGSAHPGGGIPLVLLSAKHVSALVQEQWS